VEGCRKGGPGGLPRVCEDEQLILARVPAGAKPGELMEISEETASKIASGGWQAAAQKEKKEIIEFKVPAAGGNSQKSASY
jgi:hypothetical protein